MSVAEIHDLLTIVSELARLIIPRHQIVVLRPVALGDDEDEVRVRLLHVFVEAPQEVRGVHQPRDVDHDDVAQGEGHEEGRLHRVVPVLEGRVNRQQDEAHEVEDPVEPLGKRVERRQ